MGRLADTLSNTIAITNPREVIVEDFERSLGRLYREHVQSRVQPFRTHLPRYSLAVAAGKFLENPEVDETPPIGKKSPPPRARAAGDVRGAHCGALDGAAHSGWQLVRVSHVRGRFARRAIGAGGVARAAGPMTATR